MRTRLLVHSWVRGHACMKAGLTHRLQLDWYPPTTEHGGFFARSFWAIQSRRLDVSILPLPQYGSVAQLFSTGKADLASAPATRSLTGTKRPSPPRGLRNTCARPSGIMVHQESPIHDFKDLEGHAIAAQTGAMAQIRDSPL